MNDLTLNFATTLKLRPFAYRYALKAHEALKLEGFTNHSAPEKHQCAVFMTVRDDWPVGILAWEYDLDDAEAWITLAYVEKSHRGQGIFRKMWDNMRTHAQMEGCKNIRLGVMECNTAAREVYERMGGEQYARMYQWRIA